MEDSDEVSIKLEKQNLIREEIINKGFDSIEFIEYLIQCKGPGGENINSWSVPDLKNAISDFITLNKEKSKNENNLENKIENKENKEEKKEEENKEEKKEEKPTSSITPLNKNDKNYENKSEMPAPLAPQEKNLSESVLMNIIDIKNNLFTDSSKKIEKIDYGLQTPDSLDCRPIDKTDLSGHEEIYIKIGFPEKISGGFFGRDSVSFTITAIPLGFVVKRNYFDFEWLSNILMKLYNGNFIPSVPQLFMYQRKGNDDIFFKELIRNLEKFINYLLLDPIIKNSQIFYDFLCIENEFEFKKKQKEYENITPSNDIQNYQSINGKIDINITEEAEKKFNIIKNFSNEKEKLFRQINYNLNTIEDDFSNIIKKLNDTSLIWEKLCNLNEKYYKNENNLQEEIYKQLKNIFNALEKFLKKENDLLKIDIKENFYFFSNNLNNFNQLFKKVDEFKRIYTKEEKDLVSLKNDLFNKVNIGKDQSDKNVDLSKLLPRNTEATLEMKKNYGFYLNRAITEYERIKKMDNDMFKERIITSYKSQYDIINKFQGEMKEFISTIDELGKQKKVEKKEEKKEEYKDNNINKINSD